jgi:hypothetical protein
VQAATCERITSELLPHKFEMGANTLLTN